MRYSLTRRRFLATTLKALSAGALAHALGSPWAKGQSTAAWQPVSPQSASPPARLNHGMIYDPLGDRLVAFGGSGQGGFLNDVWAYSFESNGWSELTPAGPSPAPRRTPTSVYDPQGHRMVIYSGQGNGFFNDTWAFDLSGERWSELPGMPRPLARYGTILAYDPSRRGALTFAGFTSERGRFDDLWTFSLEADGWQQVSFSGAQPGKRCLHAGAYDSDGDRLFVYAGQRSGPLDDLWAFDPLAGTWQEFTNGPRPAARMFTSLVHDPERAQLLAFGGRGAQTYGDLWSFDLHAELWNKITPSGTGPQARDGHSAVWVPNRGMVAFGGMGQTVLNDLWLLTIE